MDNKELPYYDLGISNMAVLLSYSLGLSSSVFA